MGVILDDYLIRVNLNDVDIRVKARPLGASAGDWLSQQGNQGLDLGTTVTSYLFLSTIVALVAYLQVRKPDITPVELANADADLR